MRPGPHGPSHHPRTEAWEHHGFPWLKLAIVDAIATTPFLMPTFPLAFLLSCLFTTAAAQTAGSFADGGDTLVSAMMVSLSINIVSPHRRTNCPNRCSSETSRRYTSWTRLKAMATRSMDIPRGVLCGMVSYAWSLYHSLRSDCHPIPT